MSKLKTHSITKTNELFYVGAVVVTNRLGAKKEKNLIFPNVEEKVAK